MFPREVAVALNNLGHDGISIHELDLTGAPDGEVYNAALKESRIVVPENFADFSTILDQRLGRTEPCVPVVFIRKSDFPSGDALATHVARHLDRWAHDNPEPYLVPHWP